MYIKYTLPVVTLPVVRGLVHFLTLGLLYRLYNREDLYMGYFITVEGIDGSGKDTVIEGLTKYLREQGKRVYVSELNEGYRLDYHIRMMLKSQEADMLELASLFIAKHYSAIRHFQDVLLDPDGFVISNRWTSSTAAYNADNLEEMEAILTMSPKLRQDVILYLDVEPNIAMQRIGNRGKVKEIFEDLNKLKEIKNRYDLLERMIPERFTRINTNELTQDEVVLEATELITDILL